MMPDTSAPFSSSDGKCRLSEVVQVHPTAAQQLCPHTTGRGQEAVWYFLQHTYHSTQYSCHLGIHDVLIHLFHSTITEVGYSEHICVYVCVWERGGGGEGGVNM